MLAAFCREMVKGLKYLYHRVCTYGRHRCDKPVNVFQGSFQIVTVEKTVNGNFIGQLYFELLEEGNLLVSMSVRRK